MKLLTRIAAGLGISAVVLCASVTASAVDIATAADLASVAGDGEYRLTADIVLGDFTPIGSADAPFTGVFDGAGHTIAGGTRTALFAYTDGDAYIHDLTLENVTVSTADKCGGIVARALGETVIENCSFNGVFDVSAVVGVLGVSGGGIAGYAAPDATVKNCESTLSLAITKAPFILYAGGIVGENGGTVVGCKTYGTLAASTDNYLLAIGGIAGENMGFVSNCFNYGSVTGQSLAESAYSRAGGIVGFNNGGHIRATENRGAISSAGYNRFPSYGGGIVGYNLNGPVEYSKNTATVIGGTSFLGGIAGINLGNRDLAAVDGCLSTGDVAGAGSVAGGIVGGIATTAYAESEVYVTNSVTYGALDAVGAESVGDASYAEIQNVYNENDADVLKANTPANGLGDDKWIFQTIGLFPDLIVPADDEKQQIFVTGVNLEESKTSISFYLPEASTDTYVVAFYGENRLTGAKILRGANMSGSVYTAILDFAEGTDTIRVLPFSSLDTLTPADDVERVGVSWAKDTDGVLPSDVDLDVYELFI